MDYKAKFDKGISVEKFESILGENKSLHDLHYSRADIEKYRSELGALPPLRIIVLTEPWCGDSIAVVPVLLKLFENNDAVEIRFLLRDQNPELMEQFLSNGARAIPKILVLDGNYILLFHWGARPTAAQNIFENHRADIEAGKIEKIEVIKKIRNFYSKEKGRSIAEEFTKKLMEYVKDA